VQVTDETTETYVREFAHSHLTVISSALKYIKAIISYALAVTQRIPHQDRILLQKKSQNYVRNETVLSLYT
jgi:hypothetical protein